MSVEIKDPAVALAVLQKSKDYNIFKAEIPTDPKQILAQGQELYQLALGAREAGMNETPVPEVIAMVEGAAQAPNPFGAAAAGAPVPAPPAAPPIAPPAPPAPPVAPPAPPAPPVPAVPEKVMIVELASGTQYEVDAENVPQYVVSGQYAVVEQEAPSAPPAQPAAPTPPSGPVPTGVPAIDPSQYAAVQPWEGYATDTIPNITERIEAIFREQDGDSIKRIMAHVWEYEARNKNRTRLLNKLKELHEKGVQTASPVAPPQQQFVPPPAAEGSDVQPTPPFQQPQPPVNTSVAPPAAPQVFQPASGGDELMEPLQGTTQKSEAAIRAERLPIPAEIEGETYIVPQDFTGLGDVQLAQYASFYTAYLVRVNWLAALAEGHSADAKIVADGYMREYKAGNPAPAKTTVDQIEAQAIAADPRIAYAKQVQAEYGGHAKMLRELSNNYQETLVRLSREQTRREKEREVAR